MPAAWPYDPGRLPFFYGWVIWALSTLGFLMSVPGQTMGMAVFTEPFMEAFSLGRTELATAYFFGTTASSLFLTRAGRWYDRYQARTMMVGASVVLSAVLVFMSGIDVLIAPLGDGWRGTLAFALVLVGYFGVRFTGQGVLTSVSRNVLLVWFERRRGLVSGVRGVFVSLGFSVAPLLLAMLIDAWGWRGALWILAATVGGAFALLSLVAIRDTPESCGLLPDGAEAADRSREPAHAVPQDATVTEARRCPVFWIYAGSLALHALFTTAITFHIVDIFAHAGRGAGEAFGYFFPQAVVSTSVNLVASALVDRLPLKPYLLLMLTALGAGGWGLMHLESAWGYWLLVAGLGSGGGLWGVLSNMAYVRNFGRLHLGEISGLAMSLTVFASAVGPVLFSVGVDWLGSYTGAIGVCLGLIAGLAAIAALVSQREPAR